MALLFKNYSLSIDKINEEKLLLNGALNSTVVKSLEIITGDESCTVNIIRKKNIGGNLQQYATIKTDLKANDYLLLWEGFFVIPINHSIYVSCNSSKCKVIANVVEL